MTPGYDLRQALGFLAAALERDSVEIAAEVADSGGSWVVTVAVGDAHLGAVGAGCFAVDKLTGDVAHHPEALGVLADRYGWRLFRTDGARDLDDFGPEELRLL